MVVAEIIKGVFAPIAGILEKREERKATIATAAAKLQQAKSEGQLQVTFNDQELERVLASQKQSSWVDEYITVSVMSVFNLIVLGGILAAFGYSTLLVGIGTALTAITAAGVDFGFLLQAVVLAGIGLNVWRKF